MPEITIIVALITAIAAIIAPVITAVINVRANRKLKVLELFYKRKTDAYLDFIKATSIMQGKVRPEIDSLTKIQEAGSSALLFSTKDTQSKISDYCVKLLRMDYSPAGLSTLQNAYYDAIMAMQSEINEYSK